MAKKPRRCKHCGHIGTPESPVSQRYLCRECAFSRVSVAAYALQDGEGPHYHRYLDGQIAGLRRRLDQLEAKRRQLLHAGANVLESDAAPGGADGEGSSS